MAQRLEAALKRPLTPSSAAAPPRPAAPPPAAPPPPAPPASAAPAAPAPGGTEFDLAAAVAAELDLAPEESAGEPDGEKKPENVSIYDEILKRDT